MDFCKCCCSGRRASGQCVSEAYAQLIISADDDYCCCCCSSLFESDLICSLLITDSLLFGCWSVVVKCSDLHSRLFFLSLTNLQLSLSLFLSVVASYSAVSFTMCVCVCYSVRQKKCKICCCGCCSLVDLNSNRRTRGQWKEQGCGRGQSSSGRGSRKPERESLRVESASVVSCGGSRLLVHTLHHSISNEWQCVLLLSVLGAKVAQKSLGEAGERSWVSQPLKESCHCWLSFLLYSLDSCPFAAYQPAKGPGKENHRSS